MEIPANYSEINNTYLNIVLIPGESTNTSRIGFNWTCSDFTSRNMEIKISFEYPLDISLIGVKYFFSYFRAPTQ